ncbi:hypothetical protein [Streptomyces sp. NPDC058745]|uniref:hypothetical protein n=1 Tax=Streptomyces sp. NPDC058745 TaxID=3346621 RepID=UPI00369D4F08
MRHSTTGGASGRTSRPPHRKRSPRRSPPSTRSTCGKAAVGKAKGEVGGVDSFSEGSGGFAQAEPVEYSYEDESTYAEYFVQVHETGLATVAISYVKVEDIVTILEALELALAEHRTA